MELANDTDAERLTRDRLLQLCETHPLERWLHTDRIRIDERTAVPHSHPVLTLNTRYDENELLSAYVHEQLHWYVVWPGDEPEIFAELRARYRGLPVGPPEGCRDEFSNLLHLVVNSLEYASLTELLGKDAARDLLVSKRYYRTIYRTVLADDEQLTALIKAQGWLPLP